MSGIFRWLWHRMSVDGPTHEMSESQDFNDSGVKDLGFVKMSDIDTYNGKE